MGRTKRKRKRNRLSDRKFYSCNGSNETILLNTWLSGQGFRGNQKLSLAVFNSTGRGVLTKKKIFPGEELVNLSLNSTINVTTLLMDKVFCNLFLCNRRQCFKDYKCKVSFQALMALYLSFLKCCGSDSKWYVYLKSLPTHYTVPYFLPNEIKEYLSNDIQSIIKKQKSIIDSTFTIFDAILNSANCDNYVDDMKIKFTKPCYEWAYFTVNTRCVFMDLSKVVDLEHVENSILNLVYDNTNISLCPYLDMINHSPSAKNETTLIVSRDVNNLSLDVLDENSLCDVRFSISTKNSIDKFSEVFICYGDSHNLKLVTEYGFYILKNELDSVTFSLDEIVLYFNVNSKKLSKDQITFINNHGLNKDLYIDYKGLSFNLYALLMVVNYYYKENTNVSKLIYSAALCSNDKLLNESIKPLTIQKLQVLKESISNLKTSDVKSFILDNCVALMCQYVNILEKFNKC